MHTIITTPGRGSTVSEYRFLKWQSYDDGRIVRISLNRPDQRNAQNRGMLVELDEAFGCAEADDAVRVVILAGEGKMFSSGHDIGSKQARAEYRLGPDQHPTATINGGSREGAEYCMLQEWHYFFQNTLRWRNLRKITIAQVHGEVFSAGLMLMWACDLIVGSDDVRFADVVGTRLGMCGMEYFGHPWEFGPRKAKELLLTGDAIDVHEAHRLGMVSKVFTGADLADRTLDLARRIAEVPTMAALLIKESVNQTQDNMGFHNSLQACFTLHQLNHAHWAQVREDGRATAGPENGVPDWRSAPPVVLSVKDQVRAPG